MSDSNPDTRNSEDHSDRLVEEVPASYRLLTERFITDDEENHHPHNYVCRLLYISHFLSAWNSRAFEFGAFLFLATIYPQTLLPASIYALTRAGTAAVLSPWLGGYIDHTDRLTAVRLSIVGQRVSVAVSCALLFCLCQFEDIRNRQAWSFTALALLSTLACIEKLAAIMNTISVERDWVVIIAQDDDDRLMSTYDTGQHDLLNRNVKNN